MEATEETMCGFRDEIVGNGFGGDPEPFLDGITVVPLNRPSLRETSGVTDYKICIYPKDGYMANDHFCYLADFARAHRCDITIDCNWDGNAVITVRKFKD